MRLFATLAAVGAALVLAAPAAAVRYTYSVETAGDVGADVDQFAAIARSTLNDGRGWSLGGRIDFDQVRSGGDLRLVLASPSAVANAHPVCSSFWSCRVGNRVLINDERWRQTTPTWPLSATEYRRYVINHELGHWLGLPGRRPCPGSGAQAPVMMQQSKGLDVCEANVWPLAAERQAVAEARGLDAPDEARDEPTGDTSTASTPEWPGRYLMLGSPMMTGEDVRRFQERMRERGWVNSNDRPLTVDGIYGPETARVTRLFQRQKGLAVDGIVGPNTWRAAWEKPVT